MSVLKRLENAANNNHGIMLQPSDVRILAETIMNIEARLSWLQNIQVAYMNEYGATLFYELVGSDIIEGEIEEEDAEASDEPSADELRDNFAAAEGGRGEADEKNQYEALVPYFFTEADEEGQVHEATGVDTQEPVAEEVLEARNEQRDCERSHGHDVHG